MTYEDAQVLGRAWAKFEAELRPVSEPWMPNALESLVWANDASPLARPAMARVIVACAQEAWKELQQEREQPREGEG